MLLGFLLHPESLEEEVVVVGALMRVQGRFFIRDGFEVLQHRRRQDRQRAHGHMQSRLAPAGLELRGGAQRGGHGRRTCRIVLLVVLSRAVTQVWYQRNSIKSCSKSFTRCPANPEELCWGFAPGSGEGI